MENPLIRNRRPVVKSIPRVIAIPLTSLSPPGRAARVSGGVAP